MDFMGIMLNEISQRKTIGSHSYEEPEKKKKNKQVTDTEVADGVGKMGEGSQKVQTSSYEISPGGVRIVSQQ